MVLTQRVVQSVGTLANFSKNQALLTLPAEKVLPKVDHDAMVALLDQISSLMTYANDLYSGLLQEASVTAKRVAQVNSRLDSLRGQPLSSADRFFSSADEKTLMDYPRVPWRSKKSASAQLFNKNTPAWENSPLRLAYEQCIAPPNLSLLDPYNDDPKRQSCLKNYTNPQFFVDEWIAQQLREHEKAKERIAKKRQTRAPKKRTEVEKKKVKRLKKTRYNQWGEKIVDEGDEAEAASSPAAAAPSRPAASPAVQVTTETKPVAAAAPPARPAVQAPPLTSPPAVPATTMSPRPPAPALSAPARSAPPPPGTAAPPPPPMVSTMATPAPPPPPLATSAPPPPPMASNAPRAPAPPPAAPAPPPMAPAAPAAPSAPAPVDAPAKANTNARSNLLAQIQSGIQLKKASERKLEEKPQSISDGPFNVAAILARRIAIEGSDSEDEDAEEEENDDWED